MAGEKESCVQGTAFQTTNYLWAGEGLAGGWPWLSSGPWGHYWERNCLWDTYKYGCHFQKYLINKEPKKKKVLKSIKSLKVIHMREINHPSVFWQSWWFLCAVLTVNVWLHHLEHPSWTIILNSTKYPFSLLWWLKQHLPTSCTVYSEEVRESGIILETGEYSPQEYSPPFRSWGCGVGGPKMQISGWVWENLD